MSSALYFLTTEQMHLFRAALCPPDEALAHWQAWRRLRNLHRDTLSDEQVHSTLSLLDTTQQRLLPLINQNLAWAGDTLLPYVQAMTDAMQTADRQRALAEVAVLESLQQAKIRMLLLNGLSTTLASEQQHILRPTLELTILVSEAEADAALDVLRQQQLIPSSFSFRHRRWLSSVLLTRADGLRVRLQRHVFSQHDYAGADERFWQKAQTVGLPGGASVLTLSPTHQLFYTLVQGHQGGRKMAFASLSDSMQLIRGTSVNWDELVHLAEHFTFRLPVQRSLKAMQKQADLSLPATVEQRLRRMVLTVAEQRYFDLLTVAATDAPRQYLLNLRVGQLAFRLFRRHQSCLSLSSYLWSYLTPYLTWPEGELSV